MENRNIDRYVTAAIVIGGMIGTYFFSRPRTKGIFTKLDRRQKKRTDRNLLTPANETFGIMWPVIYSGTAALAIHQALPSQADNPRYEKAQPWLRASYLLGGAFGYFFSKPDRKSQAAAAAITIGMLPVALALHRSLEIGQTDVPEPENTLRKFISLYTGWLTAASAVSATSLVQDAGYAVRKDDAKTWALASLPVTGGLAALTSRMLNDPYLLPALVAAFTGIAAKQKDRNRELSYEAGGLAAALTGFFANEVLAKKSLGEAG